MATSKEISKPPTAAEAIIETHQLRKAIADGEFRLANAVLPDKAEERTREKLEANRERLKKLGPLVSEKEVQRELAMARGVLLRAAEAYLEARLQLFALKGIQRGPRGLPTLDDLLEPASYEPGEVKREVNPTQALHVERRRNEKAGRGYFTDEELTQKDNPEFWGGAGATVAPALAAEGDVPGTGN